MRAFRILHSRISLAGGALFALIFNCYALDPSRTVSQYARESWGLRSGLPRGQVSSITQGADGYLWIGTEQGPRRFDGLGFTSLEVSGSDPFPPDRVLGLTSDQAGGLWMTGALNGKVGGAFTSTATQHGGQETTLFSIITNLLHFGLTVVGLPYSFQGQMKLDEITGGSPYGATTIAGGQGQRQPSANELDGARFQGKLIAETAKKLFPG